MKKQNSLLKTILCMLAVFYLWTFPQLAEDLKDRPDSLRYVMGINVDDSSIEELSGADVPAFRLYTRPKITTVLWKKGKYYYFYNFSEGDHLLRATALFNQLRHNGLETFVAQRKGKKVRFHEYRQVFAIQVKAPQN